MTRATLIMLMVGLSSVLGLACTHRVGDPGIRASDADAGIEDASPWTDGPVSSSGRAEPSAESIVEETADSTNEQPALTLAQAIAAVSDPVAIELVPEPSMVDDQPIPPEGVVELEEHTLDFLVARERIDPITACRSMLASGGYAPSGESSCEVELTTTRLIPLTDEQIAAGEVKPRLVEASLVWADDPPDRGLLLVWSPDETRTDIVRVAWRSWGVNWDESLTLKRFELIAAEQPRIVIELERDGEGSACTEPLSWTVRERQLVVCSRQEDEPVCTTPIPLSVHELETRYSWDDELDQGRTRVSADYSLRVEHTDDGLRLRRGHGRVPRQWRRLLGHRSLGELVERPLPEY